MKLENVLVVYTTPRNNEQRATLENIKRVLKKYEIGCRLENRDRLVRKHFENRDFVIAAGGDGTFLRAAQLIENQIILGVNADVRNKEGFFMKASKKNFDAMLLKVMKGHFRILRMPRLEAYINGKKIESLAANEFFIGSRKSYHAAKYTIHIGGKAERQKSSGILVSTPIGSHAWAKSCCSRTLPLGSKDYQYVVREPYEGNVFKNYRLKYGVLKKGQKIKIKSEMLDGMLIADSVGKEHRFRNGSTATIGMSKKYLSAVWA